MHVAAGGEPSGGAAGGRRGAGGQRARRQRAADTAGRAEELLQRHGVQLRSTCVSSSSCTVLPAAFWWSRVPAGNICMHACISGCFTPAAA